MTNGFVGVTFGFNNPRNRVTIHRISGFSYDVISYKYLSISVADPDLKVRWGPLSNILYLSFHSFGILSTRVYSAFKMAAAILKAE